MTTIGSRITEEKRRALADCNGLIQILSGQLDDLVERGRVHGLDLYEVEDLAPITQRVLMLRRRRERLEDELHAVASEWSE